MKNSRTANCIFFFLGDGENGITAVNFFQKVIFK